LVSPFNTANGEGKEGMFLNQLLSEEHRKLGLALEEDDHCVRLMDKDGRNLAIFTANADIKCILEEANKCCELIIESAKVSVLLPVSV
jgi:hypothetical protein